MTSSASDASRGTVASAAELRRQRTRTAITASARALTREHGIDGFTMEQLAEEVGVSRRTLFNHVPGKVDAVLGTPPMPEPGTCETFLAGGPTGHLLTDVKILATSILDSPEITPAEFAELRDLLRSDPRLIGLLHERFADSNDDVTQLLVSREGDRFDPQMADLLRLLFVGMFDAALDRSLADPSRSMTEHFSQVFDATAALFTHLPR